MRPHVTIRYDVNAQDELFLAELRRHPAHLVNAADLYYYGPLGGAVFTIGPVNVLPSDQTWELFWIAVEVASAARRVLEGRQPEVGIELATSGDMVWLTRKRGANEVEVSATYDESNTPVLDGRCVLATAGAAELAVAAQRAASRLFDDMYAAFAGFERNRSVASVVRRVRAALPQP